MSGFIKDINRSHSTLFPESLNDFVNADITDVEIEPEDFVLDNNDDDIIID